MCAHILEKNNKKNTNNNNESNVLNLYYDNTPPLIEVDNIPWLLLLLLFVVL